MTTDRQQWLLDVRAGRKDALDKLYKQHREEFASWLAKHYNCNEEDALDIYQDSIIIVYGHIKSGKLTELTGSFKSYLFGVGKRVFLNKARKSKLKTNNIDDHPGLEAEPNTGMELDERQTVLLKLLKKLREPCKGIILMYYYQRYSLDSIAAALGYNSKEVAKTQKGRCIKQLREIAAKHYKQGDI